jgi:hypothetical protein
MAATFPDPLARAVPSGKRREFPPNQHSRAGLRRQMSLPRDLVAAPDRSVRDRNTRYALPR